MLLEVRERTCHNYTVIYDYYKIVQKDLFVERLGVIDLFILFNIRFFPSTKNYDPLRIKNVTGKISTS